MKKGLAIVNILVFSGMLYLNYLGGAGKINNISTGEVSGLYPNLFTPAGFTFSIWGVIYLLNLSFIIHQVYKAFRLPENFDLRLNQGFFFISITNSVWIIAWHRLAVGYSLFLMFMLLIFLLGTYWQARRPKYTSEYITEFVNFSVYLGWISVATIANTTIFLTSVGVANQGSLATVLTVVVIAIAVGLGLYFILKQRNVWYALVILWASYGIYAARDAGMVSSSEAIPEGTEIVKIAAITAVFIIFAGLVYFRIQQSKLKKA
jgi:hypothetical protein